LDHRQRGCEVEGTAAGTGGDGDGAEIVSLDHFPTAETSPEVMNEGSGAVVWREMGEHEEVAGARRGRRGMGAATTAAARTAAARGRAGSSEERAAVRIQAFYRGYLVRNLILYHILLKLNFFATFLLVLLVTSVLCSENHWPSCYC